jgi:branched-chain amino acid transport system ATP-binding protein
MLKVEHLSVNYGAVRALDGVDFTLEPGQVLAVLGRNGSGRSTLARALMGLVPGRGRVQWHGRELLGLAPHTIARCGVAYVPETRDVFALLTVEQNLQLGLAGRTRHRIDWAYATFGQLKLRQHTLAGLLSGGEQQMLSLARSLMAQPDLLIVDEPAEGLAPHWVETVGQVLREQAARGTAILLMEQKLDLAPVLAHRLMVLGRGQVVFAGTLEALQGDPTLQQTWLGLD